MSMQTLNAIAVERDHAAPKKRKTGRAAPQAANADALLSKTDILIAAIPTEVLALYTGLVTAIIANTSSDAGADKHLLLRWGLYVAGFAAITVWLGANYLRTLTKKRRFPWVETAAAMFAFAAWGLVMPGSPLGEELSKANTNIWYPIITAAGLFSLGILGIPLRQKTSKA